MNWYFKLLNYQTRLIWTARLVTNQRIKLFLNEVQTE